MVSLTYTCIYFYLSFAFSFCADCSLSEELFFALSLMRYSLKEVTIYRIALMKFSLLSNKVICCYSICAII